MKPIRNYILLVDAHRRSSRRRPTAGRYRVGAKSEKEAITLLREKIKFGSIQVYYCDATEKNQIGYKEVVREIFENGHYKHIRPIHATAPQSRK